MPRINGDLPLKFNMARAGGELELELIQSHMAQKPMLRGEVGCACVARKVSVEKMVTAINMSHINGFLLLISCCFRQGAPTRAPHFTPQHWLLCHMGLY